MAKSTARAGAAPARARRAAGESGATKKDTAALEREIAELRAKLGQRGPAPDEDVQEYPKAKYRKHKVDARHPNGYEKRRVNSSEEEANLPRGWVDGPPDPEWGPAVPVVES